MGTVFKYFIDGRIVIVSEFNRLNRPGIVQFLMKRTGMNLSELNARLRDDTWTDSEREVMEKSLKEWETLLIKNNNY